MKELRSVTIKMDAELFEQIANIAGKRGDTLSGTVRHLLQKGLAERIVEGNTELITRLFRNELDSALRRHAVYMAGVPADLAPPLARDMAEQRVCLYRTGSSWPQIPNRARCPVN